MVRWPIDERGVALIKESESLRLESYLCPAGKWTCGYGETGPDIGPTTKFTAEEADCRLRERLEDLARSVTNVCAVAPNACQLAAMVSLGFNIGFGAFRWSSVLRQHNRGQPEAAARAFNLWVKATIKGQLVTLPGLVTRRAREAELYLQAG